jgi:hypothetical protein
MRFSDPRQASGHSSERQMAYAAQWAAEHDLLLDETLSLRWGSAFVATFVAGFFSVFLVVAMGPP